MAREHWIETDLPLRLDRLPWSTFHWRVVIALGITWLLDGLEVTVVGAVASVLEKPETLGLSATQLGLAGSAYLGGAIGGALLFGHLTDRYGRKRLFLITLALYVLATVLTACAFDFASFFAFRALTGAAIGGEYAAINSAIDELLPARVRGRVDLAINGTYWLGTALGAGLSLLLLDPVRLPVDIGWRLCFGAGALLTVAVVLVRRYVPESPRWLLLRGRAAEAEAVVSRIEQEVSRGDAHALEPTQRTLWLDPSQRVGFRDVLHVVLQRYRARSVLCLCLMVAQAFFYNAIFFTYSLLLTRFFAVPVDDVGLYLLPFALANFLGPLLLGKLFDSVGRRPLLVATYAGSGLLLLGVGLAFRAGLLDATTQSWAFSLVFFVGSAAASAAYLTVSEVFPIELRALAIAAFYAIGTGVGGLGAPALFGHLIQSGQRGDVFAGYVLGAGLMLGAALVAARLAVPAERRALEDVAEPLSARRV